MSVIYTLHLPAKSIGGRGSGLGRLGIGWDRERQNMRTKKGSLCKGWAREQRQSVTREKGKESK